MAINSQGAQINKIGDEDNGEEEICVAEDEVVMKYVEGQVVEEEARADVVVDQVVLIPWLATNVG